MFKKNLLLISILLLACILENYTCKYLTGDKPYFDDNNIHSNDANFGSDFEESKEEALREIQNNIFRYGSLKPADIANGMVAFDKIPLSESSEKRKTEKETTPTKKKSRKKLRMRKIMKSKQNKLSEKLEKRFNRILPICASAFRNTRAVQTVCKRMEALSERSEPSEKIQNLLTHLYEAEAKVQMEAGEVGRAQQVAAAAQVNLEEATNKVRVLASELQAAQNAAQTAGANAHIAQMELAKHDKLLFEARSKVSKYSNEMVELEGKLAGFQPNCSSSHTEIKMPAISSSANDTHFSPKLKPNCFGPNCHGIKKKNFN